MNETSYRNQLQIDLSTAGLRVWRNNTGVFFTAEGIPTRAGLAKGSADLIGLVPAHWHGNARAIFLSIETKSAHGRTRTEQEHWRDMVNNHGGVALIVRPGDDVVKLIREAIQ